MSASLSPQSSATEASRTGREVPNRRRLAMRWRRFGANDSGSVAVVFACLLLVLCLFVGAAVDFGRWAQARHQTGVALDAAALAGARTLLVTHDVEASKEAARTFYLANTIDRTDVLEEVVVFDALDNNVAFEGTSTTSIRPAFLGLAGINKLDLVTYARADLPQHPLEISMMLDITGSMQDSKNTKKISALKKAAKNLVDIVIKPGQPKNLVRVALVPFSDAVRLPASAYTKAVGIEERTVDKIVKRTSGSGSSQRAYLYNRTEECVVERSGTYRYTDAEPGVENRPENYVMPYRPQQASLLTRDGTVLVDGRSNTNTQGAKVTVQWASNSSMSQNQKNSFVTTANSLGSCSISAQGELVPLTDDRQLLFNRIEDLPATGMTAGHLGTAWAWYTLSPNWNSLWSSSSAATAYDSDTQKIAILMTDGEYNTQYDASGISTSAAGSGSAVNGTSDAQARSLCTSMKAKGITVYTVGFALGRNSQAERTLNFCASNPSTAYTAESGPQLQDAFQDIALKITNLHLSQ